MRRHSGGVQPGHNLKYNVATHLSYLVIITANLAAANISL